ncbi:MAG TPA: tetratricopeptide repeat protein, partial [bacterium]|nr:tetratricopeptide repeat protein [bacterium]
MKKNIILMFTIFTFLVYGREFTDLINEGVIYLKTEEYVKAINIFEEAKKISPENSDVYYYLGEAYYRKGESDKAITNLQKAININSQNLSYYYTLALVYLSQNKKSEAIETLNKIINTAPLTYYGKNAIKLKNDIENSEKEIQITKKWEQQEIEEKKRKEEEKKKEEKTTSEGLPSNILQELPPEMLKNIGTTQSSEVTKTPIPTLIKRIKFGTEEIRKKASGEIVTYSATEIQKVISDILSIIKDEKEPEVKRNLILAAGKINNSEVIDMLLEIIKDEEELFEIRIVALDTISNLKAEKVIEELRNTLSSMISRREKEREDARKNIQEINTKVDDLTAKQIVLNSEIQNLNNRIAQIDNQLYSYNEEFPAGAPPGITPGGRKPLTDKETKKLLEEKRISEEKIKTNNEEIEKIKKELEDLTTRKRKYEELLELRKRKIDITGIGASAAV